VQGPQIAAQDVELYALAQQDSAAGGAQALQAELADAERAIQKMQGTLERLARMAQGESDSQSADRPFREQMDEAARRIVQRAIQREGSIRAAAKALGLSRQHLYLKCKNLGLEGL
jgi:transcriptional regulator with PAS, ATPase and Fis domain